MKTLRIGILVIFVMIAILGFPMVNTAIVKADEVDEVKQIAEAAMKEHLKAPATAIFTYKLIITPEKQDMRILKIMVENLDSGIVYSFVGTIDSQNSFGAMLRSNFICFLEKKDDEWVVKSITIGGQIYYE
jgi:hypothetical protein